jgi:hypothetical protein
MSIVTVEFDTEARKLMDGLKRYFRLRSDVDVIRRGIVLLDMAKDIEESEGKLVAKKDNFETELVLR